MAVETGAENVTSIDAAALEAAVTGDPEALDVHLTMVERDVLISGRSVRIHCHCLSVDGNGRVQPRRLAEFMRNAVVDYTLPRSKIAEAKARDAKYNSTETISELFERAKRTFTDLARTGEGGELLLFLLAERFLKLPQILCKMDLKTDARMHYHGADGVYAGITSEGLLKLYWGESKIYEDPGEAIRSCLSSLAPYLIEPEHEAAERERDLLLLSDRADLRDPQLTAALRKYFDRSSLQSKRVCYCGLALVGFGAPFYPGGDAQTKAEEIVKAASDALKEWGEKVDKGLVDNKLENLEIDFFCIPLPSAQGFRDAFLKAMGLRE